MPARFVREALGDLGIQEVVDPMAGSGLRGTLDGPVSFAGSTFCALTNMIRLISLK